MCQISYIHMRFMSMVTFCDLILTLSRAEYLNINPRPAGYSAERAPLLAYSAPSPLPNSRTKRRSDADEAAIKSPEREDFNGY